jgi:hypothetical protein
MCHLGYTPCLADPDVWMRSAKQPDGSACWEYILLYVNDALAIGVNAEKMLREEIGRYFELKEASIGPPKIYLGGRMRQVILDNGMKVWGISLSQYVQSAVNNVEKYLKEKGQCLPKKADTPMRTSYCPMLDVSAKLDAEEGSYYMSLIGILRWMVELGRVDICLEVSFLSLHLALPRRGHMDQVLHIFAYLKVHHNAEIVLDPSYLLPMIGQQVNLDMSKGRSSCLQICPSQEGLVSQYGQRLMQTMPLILSLDIPGRGS